ncbi:hypothetical protein [Methylomonas albis]|uniref:TIR domain-containing protein n=1 Tax=Methylomonas albis TaxID=1854563 RepID=A0ABR9D735_9GAMM|nr:hypothetical protein [Methylomonas albis]MBD9358934.1 hypothetical protein [Methylomonas albis]
MISRECDIYIDLLHNQSASPQDEVIKQLISSDLLIQITTPSIDESNWASLEASLAVKHDIQTFFVEYFNSNPSQLIFELMEIVKSNKSRQNDTLSRASA